MGRLDLGKPLGISGLALLDDPAAAKARPPVQGQAVPKL